MFQFFGADEVDEDGEEVIQAMMRSYFDSGYEIRSVLRTLFHSEYFRSEQARFARVKGPVETVVGAVRLAGTYRTPTQGVDQLARQALFMGQGIFQPPSVEGWHEGIEWVDSGSLVERVNFVGQQLGNPKNPGVRAIIERLATERDGTWTPDDLVDQCLDLIGPVSVSPETRSVLVQFASMEGDLSLEDRESGSEQRVGDLLRLVTATREFQLA